MCACGQQEDGTILMIFMFRGKYLTNKLGHEIINIFKTDIDEHYIYVNPWGHVNDNKYGIIKTILLVRHTNNYQVEVVAKAWDLSEPLARVTDSRLSKNDTKQKLKEIKDAQNKVCKEKDIRYGGMAITDIFDFNSLNDEQEILVSFKAGEFRRPKKTLVIPYNDSDKNMGEMPRQSLHVYIKKEDRGYDYLKKIIDKSENWEERDDSQKIVLNQDNQEKQGNDNFNFLNVIGKADDELAFSNWFHYYLKNNIILNSFVREVLELNCSFSFKTEVLREEKHIDLLIMDADNKQMIVIENKIKSGINGKKNNKNSKSLSDTQESSPQIEDKITQEDSNQLKMYKDAAEKIARDRGITMENIHYFIFLPDYSTIKEEECNAEGYIIRKYSIIKQFFDRIKTSASFMNDDFSRFVLNQFVKALDRHASSYPDSLFEDTYRQFIERISELKESKKNE